ncbi:MAG TPA: prenyltransferase/squalene oxidase repeat-containing protein [Jatrophihabitans sp.]|nr:prenyltransferase/squalene oxidase repeat-containing protein [Jatrophihabitans sp.]
MPYRGSLSTGHLRAVARLAITAEGLALPAADFAGEIAQLIDRGTAARQALIARSDRFAAAAERLGGDQPSDRLHLLLGLGWRQSELLDIARREQPDEQAALLSACFNAAITLYDMLIDEHPGAGADKQVTAELVAALFRDPAATADRLDELAERADDARLALYLVLMSQCARLGQALRSRPEGDAAWDRLGALVRRLYTVQVENEAAGHADLALPSDVTLAIGELARPGDLPPPREVAGAVGTVLAVVDDAADLLADLDAGRANSLLAEASPADPELADADLYDAVAAGVAAARVAIERIQAAADDGYAVEGLVRFTRAMAMAWTDWPAVRPPEPGSPEPGSPQLGSPQPGSPDQSGPLERAVAFLLAAQATGYAEATHWLHLPRSDWSYETHPAVVAQRAVITCALLDAREVGIPVPDAVLAQDLLALLRAKHRGVRGGWSYLPSVPELPPDADDIGQVVQALARYCATDGGRLAESGDEPIRMLLDSPGEDGGVPTWVIDPRGRTAADAAVLDYLPVMGGWGTHTEVVANFGFALHCYQPHRHAGELDRLVAFLSRRQEADGSWESRWYAGPYYGTYKALALLAAHAPNSPAVARGRAFLRGRQDSAGAWALDAAEPESLSTAFALAGLACAAGAEDVTALHAGVAALLDRQASDGSWEAQPWIFFGTMSGDEAFGSSTITTAYALAALAASSRRLGHHHLAAAGTAP